MSCKSRIQFHHTPLLCSEIYHKRLSVGVIYSTFLQGKVFLNLSKRESLSLLVKKVVSELILFTKIKYFVYFKGKIKERTYKLGDMEEVSTPMGKIEALKVYRVFKEGENRKQIYWLSPEYDFALVKIIDKVWSDALVNF